MRKYLAALFVMTLAALPARAQHEGHEPTSLLVARNLLERMGGAEGSVAIDMELAALIRGRAPLFAAAPAAYAAAVTAALKAHAEDIKRAQGWRENAYFDHASSAVMETALRFYDSAPGKSLRAKQNAAARLEAAGQPAEPQNALTQEERGAEEDFERGLGTARWHAMMEVWPLNRAVANSIALEFCRTERCSVPSREALERNERLFFGWRLANAVENRLVAKIRDAMWENADEAPYSAEEGLYREQMDYVLSRFRSNILDAEESRAAAYANIFTSDEMRSWLGDWSMRDGYEGGLDAERLGEKGAKARAASEGATNALVQGIVAMVKSRYCERGNSCSVRLREALMRDAAVFLQTLDN